MKSVRLLATSALVAGFLPFAALAQTPPAPAIKPITPVAGAVAPAASGYVTREELPGLVKEILMNDPEMITSAVRKMREKQEADAKQKSLDAIKTHKTELYNDPESPSVGDATTADLTIVEFFDYHCGYCKRLVPSITQLSKEDKKLRIIFKEFPILSEDSLAASKAALAVNHLAKDKYFDYHVALMKHEGKFDEASLIAVAKPLGIDGDKMKAEMAKPEIAAELDKNHKLAEELGIQGTPALIMGDSLLPGALPYEDIKKAIAEVRAGKKPSVLQQEEAPAPGAAAAPAAPAVPAKP